MSSSSKWILGIFAVFLGFAILIFAFAIYSFTSAIATMGSDEHYDSYRGSGTESIAVVDLEGIILSSDDIVRQFRKYQKNKNVKAIVLRVNSPGGAVAPSQEIYDEVRKTRDSGKPVVISMGSVAASGGYYVSLGASTIIANPGSVTGSIGVVSEFINISGLMEKVGIESWTIKSGKYKDTGSPYRPMTHEEREYWQATIDNVYQQFINTVASERRLPADTVRFLADGRIFTGEQAYRLGLIDTLGTFETAISLAGTLGKIEGEPRVVRERKRKSLLEEFVGTKMNERLDVLQERMQPLSILEYRLLIQ